MKMLYKDIINKNLNDMGVMKIYIVSNIKNIKNIKNINNKNRNIIIKTNSINNNNDSKDRVEHHMVKDKDHLNQQNNNNNNKNNNRKIMGMVMNMIMITITRMFIRMNSMIPMVIIMDQI